jgi:hypothetical protein
MKKLLMSATIGLAFCTLLVVSCKYKNNNDITPTYRNQSTGTGANPNINVATVTGQQTVDNPATQNSSLLISNNASGWGFDSYASHPTYFKAQNGNTVILVQFSGPITAGNYALTSGTPGLGQARIIVYNAPGQPNDIGWYSKSGMVTVSSTASGFTATFSNVPCLQQNFLFPVVTVSGNVIC